MTVTTPQKFTQNVIFGNYRLGHCSMTAIAHGDLSFSRLFRLQIARASLAVNQHDNRQTIAAWPHATPAEKQPEKAH